MEDQKVRALMYSEGEGCGIKVLPGAPFTKDMVDKLHLHQHVEHTAYSPAVGTYMTNTAVCIRTVIVFALFFEDGSVYEIGAGWRRVQPGVEAWINKQHRLQSGKVHAGISDKNLDQVGKTAEDILKEWSKTDDIVALSYDYLDVLFVAKDYANAKLDEAAAESKSMIYEIDGGNPIAESGLVLRNFKACYATAKHNILKLKDPIE